jgi:Family of unknown function (DUF6055)
MSYPFRRLAAGTIAGLALSVLASSPAFASARPDTSGWPSPVASTHFVVHPSPGVSAADAQQVSENFEAAYATEVTSWGFHAPLSDGSLGGDSRVDVYVQGTFTPTDLGEALHDTENTPTTSGFAMINPNAAGNAETAAHELFHLLQYAVYAHGARFVKEGTAEWAAANVTGHTPWLVTYWDSPQQSLDCPAGSPCASSDLSYARWIFFDFLSERYGPGIVRELLDRMAALQADSGSMDLDALNDVLAAHGSSLTQAFDDFSAANAAGGYTFPGLSGSTKYLRPAVAAYTGATSISLAAQALTIDHLAAGYVRIYSGDPRSSAPNCGAAIMHISVTIPAGVQSQPSFADATGVHPITVNGGTASADLPWSNCIGAQGVLAVPNASRSADGAQFVVRMSNDVIPPRLPAGTHAPAIGLSMPVLATIARRHPYLSFRIHATAAGTLHVLLKSRYIRRSYRLRPGTNRLRLRLPSGFASGRHQIVFTAYSTTGARGKTIKRHVTIHLGR